MNSKLKILHLEDNELDAELIHDYIRSEWVDCEIKFVSKKSDFLDAIEKDTFDLFLCDFRIPTLNSGFEALDIMKAKNPEMPVLFVSGTIGEELAVELLKKGATDYVLKDKLVRLVSAIRRALQEKEDKKEKREAQKALWESEERYRNLFLNSPIGIYRTTPKGEIIVANPTLVKLLGFSSLEDLKKRDLDDEGFSSKKERDRFKEIIEKNGEVIGFETMWLKKGGAPIHILENSRVIKDQQGNILYYEGTIEDITEKKLAQDLLTKSEGQLSIAQELAHIGNWELDVLWEELTCSKGLLNIYGLDYNNVTNENFFWDMIVPEDREEVKRKIEKEIRETEDSISFYFSIMKQNGEIRKLYCILKAELENNKLRRIFGTVQDVTDQKKTESELIKAKKRAEESDNLKTEFLTQISHEIRTPLNTLFNLSHLINEEVIKTHDKELNDMFEGIETTGRRLLRTIELVINMATLNTNNYTLVRNKFNLKELTNNIIEMYSKEINDKGLNVKLEFNLKEDTLKSDEYLIKLVLENLIDNAVKYTEQGSVNIKIYENEKDKLSIDVIDTGIGISDEYLRNLFTPFTQESTGYSRKYEGNGLGLALSKKFVEILNGEISVESEKNQGSRFSVILDISTESAKENYFVSDNTDKNKK